MKGKIVTKIKGPAVWIAPASAVAGIEKFYLEPQEKLDINPPPDSILIEKENEYGWKNKVYIPRTLLNTLNQETHMINEKQAAEYN